MFIDEQRRGTRSNIRFIKRHHLLCIFTLRRSALVKINLGADAHQETGGGVQMIESYTKGLEGLPFGQRTAGLLRSARLSFF